MNLNTFDIQRVTNPTGRADVVINKFPLMGPFSRPPPLQKKSSSNSSSSQLPWGRSHVRVVLNSSSNKKSTSSRSSTAEIESRSIIAVTAGRGEARCEVGIAAINVLRPLLILYQTSDTQSYINTLTKINILNPNEILYPATFETANGNRLIDAIQKQFPTKKYTTISRQAFNYKNGQESLQKLSISSSHAVLVAVKDRSYALAATSALLTYLQDKLYMYYSSGSMKIEYQASEGHAIIDVATADRLELVQSTQEEVANKKFSSLFDILNQCITKVGSRTLRSIILQPLYSVKYIEERLECVAELIKNKPVLGAIREILPKLYNLDQLLSTGSFVPEDQESCSKKQISYLLFLNNLVDLIVGLKENIANLEQPFFQELHDFLKNPDFETIKECIGEIINEDAYYASGKVGETQRIFAIKYGINGLLDLIRKTYSERIEDLREYVESLAQKHSLPLTLANSDTKGYHIVLVLTKNFKANLKKSDLPAEFIQVCRTAHKYTMKTPELTNLSTSIDDILADLYQVSNSIVHSLMIQMKQYAELFYQLCDKIAYLDVLQSFAQVSRDHGYVRPQFSDYTEVTFGRHPLLDFLCESTPVSNPTVSCEHYNLHIVTGPNGSGKSIFIRQTMLIQVMAQIGCFVPAQTATFRPADRMFARIYNEDDIESGASSFVLETTEINFILTTMTDNSLIIIDELGRSTAVEEGTALAMAICEELTKTKAYVFVTTHFTLLTKLADMCLNIKTWQMDTIPLGYSENIKDFSLKFQFSLIPGVTTLKGYGLYMVRNGFPRSTRKYAQELIRQLPEKEETLKFKKLDERIRLKYELECKLHKLKRQKRLTVDEINTFLFKNSEDFKRIGSVDHEDLIEEISGDNKHSTFDAQPTEESGSSFEQNLNQFEHSCKESPSIYEIHQNTDTSSNNDINQNKSHHKLSPENDVSYDESECSINLTQNAFGLFGVTSEYHDKIYPFSQVSEAELSQELNRIRENRSALSDNRSLATDTGELIFKKPYPAVTKTDPTGFVDDNVSISDLNEYQFLLSLHCNKVKTSTPLIIKDNKSAQNLSISNDLHRSNLKSVPADISESDLTLGCAENDIDMESVPEESFVKNLQDSRDLVKEEIKNANIKQLDLKGNTFNEETKGVYEVNRSEASANEQFPYNNNNESMKTIASDLHLNNSSPKQHIFPNVRIIQGPNFTSTSDSLSPLSDIWCYKKNSNGMQYSSNIGQLTTNSKIINEKQDITTENPSSLFDESLRLSDSCVSDTEKQSIRDESLQGAEILCDVQQSETNSKTLDGEDKIHLQYIQKHNEIESKAKYIQDKELLQKSIEREKMETFYNEEDACNKKGIINSPMEKSQKFYKSIINKPKVDNKVISSSTDLEHSMEEEISQLNYEDKLLNHSKQAVIMGSKSEFNNSSNVSLENLVSSRSERKPGIQLKQDILNTEDKFKQYNKEVACLKKDTSDPDFIDNVVKSSTFLLTKRNEPKYNFSVLKESFTSEDSKNCPNNNSYDFASQDTLDVNENNTSTKSLNKQINILENKVLQTQTKASTHPDSINYVIKSSSSLLIKPKEPKYNFSELKELPENFTSEEELDSKNCLNNSYDFASQDTLDKSLIQKIDILENKVLQTQAKAIKTRLEISLFQKEASPLNVFNNHVNDFVKPDSSKYSQEFSEMNQTSNSGSIAEIQKFCDLEPEVMKDSLKTVPKEKSLTSISEASNIRNLEGYGIMTSSGSDGTNIYSNSLKGVSEASKKRNLDEVTSSTEISTSTMLNVTSTFVEQCSTDSNFSADLVPKKRAKNLSKDNMTRLKKYKKRNKKSNRVQCKKVNKKFVPPLKLIKQNFEEENRKIIESSDCELWKQKLNRSAIKQIKYLATLVKTNEGVEVIPTKEKPLRKFTKRNSIQKPALSSQQSSFNSSIFSDKNASGFDAFINSDQTNLRYFPFAPECSKNNPKDGNLFNFVEKDE